MSPLPPKDDRDVLLNIYERLGAIENELQSLIKARDALEHTIDELQDFKRRIGAYLWLGSSLASGVLFFLFEGARYWVEKVFNHG